MFINPKPSYDDIRLESRKVDQTDVNPKAAIGWVLLLLFNKQFKAMRQKVLVLFYMSDFFLENSLYESIVAGKKAKQISAEKQNYGKQ